MNYSIIIPARYESTRLPGKPLVDIAGKPMIIRTWEQCVKAASPEDIYVATDDERVESVCKAHGAQVIMTSVDCLTGTDRVAECAESLDSDLFINVQGDEPIFNPGDIRNLIHAALEKPDTIINGYAPIETEEEHLSPSVPKVVVGESGNLLYMSRAPIPGNKKQEFVVGWRQICAYSFPRAALKAFASYPGRTPLEDIEDIEILRFLELGFPVQMIEMTDMSIPVDNPEDVAKVEAGFLQSSW
jgi:3-deoxy-manno-octulosonate cytidylyltransferase (CMP-KDO synthetase)